MARPLLQVDLMLAGEKLGSYVLAAPLGRGGMGEVWIATRDGEPFAVKTVLPELDGEHARALFSKEARVALALRHENVVRVHEVGEADGVCFMAMEWVDGLSLSEAVEALERKGERFAVGFALRLVIDACRGLHALHGLRGEDGTGRDVVHRDVSPHNIMVTRAGRARVIDFGLVQGAGTVESVASCSLKGKIRYMAPEQALGGRVDRRADVFSLGATLVRVLTGGTPYDGPNEVTALARLLSGETADVRLPEDAPKGLLPILHRALARDPSKRYASAEALARDLERVARGVPCSVSREMARLEGALEARRARVERHLPGLAMAPVVVEAPRRRSVSMHFDGRIALAALCTVLFGATAVSAAAHDRGSRRAIAAPTRAVVAAEGVRPSEGGPTAASAPLSASPSTLAYVEPVAAPRPRAVDRRRSRPAAASPRHPARPTPARAAAQEARPAPPSDFELALGARR